jgi:uncharacterized tellurite resistance protein B-like protein
MLPQSKSGGCVANWLVAIAERIFQYHLPTASCKLPSRALQTSIVAGLDTVVSILSTIPIHIIMNSSLKTHFLNLYAMALSDTQFDETEVALLYQIGKGRGITKEDIDDILLNPATVRFTTPENLDDRIEYLYDYTRMILADGVIEDFEIKTLHKFCKKFDFQDENIQAIVELLMEAAKNNTPTSDILQFVNQNS